MAIFIVMKRWVDGAAVESVHISEDCAREALEKLQAFENPPASNIRFSIERHIIDERETY